MINGTSQIAYLCADTPVNGDYNTHKSIAKDTSADSQSPTQTDSNDGRSDFPVRDSPGVGHPVSDVRVPFPGSLRGWDRIEVGVGSTLGFGERARLSRNLETELGNPSSEGRLTDAGVHG